MTSAQRIVSRAIALATVSAVAASAGTPLYAQPAALSLRASDKPAGQTVQPAQIAITGWRLDCRFVATTMQCEVKDQVVARASNAVIAAISIRRETPHDAPLAAVQIPLGTSFDDGVRFGFVNGAVQRLPVRTCNRGGCLATDRLGEPVVAALRAAKAPLRVAYDTLSPSGVKHTVTISVGLQGFASAYARLR